MEQDKVFFLSTLEYFISTPDFPGGSVGKEPACNAGDLGLIPGSGRSSGEGNGNPPQYSCLGNPVDRLVDLWSLVNYSPWGCQE